MEPDPAEPTRTVGRPLCHGLEGGRFQRLCRRGPRQPQGAGRGQAEATFVSVEVRVATSRCFTCAIFSNRIFSNWKVCGMEQRQSSVSVGETGVERSIIISWRVKGR